MPNDLILSDVPWVVESKFEPNRPRLGLVRRDRLLAQLHEGASKQLVLIVAPAGYGKSSLLGQWASEAQQRGIRFGWLTLESDEADEKQFLAYIVLVLSRAGVRLDELLTGARGGFADAAIDVVLAKLIRLLNASDEPMVLILEDYHSAECKAVNNIVKRLIRDTLYKFSIFIDSRRQPDIEAFSLIASGDALEINAAQLRLTREETLEVLAKATDESGGQQIYEQTEGWPVAVQLALVQKSAQPTEPILTGVDGGFVASYLTEQILSTLDDEAQEFLLAVAFLERFNSELTNYVLDSPDGWSCIGSLSSFAALIVPLDATGGWFRLHHLFAEYLRDMQKRRSQTKSKDIRLRASQWYFEKKQIVDAVRYAAYAEDFMECERIILENGGWKIILNDGIGVLKSALRLLPDAIIVSSARLMIARAYLHSKFGEIHEARALLDASCKLDEQPVTALSDMDRLAVESMINLYEDREYWTDEHARLRERYKADFALDPLGWGTMKAEETLIHLSRAEIDDASQCLRESFSLMRQSGSVLGLNYCYIHAAYIALFRGDVMSASANVERACNMAEENFGSDSGLKAIASVSEYSLRMWQGDCDVDDWSGFKKALFHTIDYDGWTTAHIAALEAAYLFSLSCDDFTDMREILTRIRLFTEQQNLLRLDRVRSFCESALALDAGAIGAAESRATDDMMQFASHYDYAAAPRDWHAYFFAAFIAAAYAPPEEAERQLDQALALAERLELGLWSIQLNLAKVSCALRANRIDAAKSQLLIVLKMALGRRVMGPFVANDAVLRLLVRLKADLRHDEGELLMLQFIDEILTCSRNLKPAKESGLLSEREHEVLQILARGLSNKEIARTLELTENTVKFHLKSLFSKLSVSKRTQAVVEAQRRGLID